MEVDFGFQPPSGVVMSRPGLARLQRGGSVTLCHHWMNAATIRDPEVRNQSEPTSYNLTFNGPGQIALRVPNECDQLDRQALT